MCAKDLVCNSRVCPNEFEYKQIYDASGENTIEVNKLQRYTYIPKGWHYTKSKLVLEYKETFSQPKQSNRFVTGQFK